MPKPASIIVATTAHGKSPPTATTSGRKFLAKCNWNGYALWTALILLTYNQMHLLDKAATDTGGAISLQRSLAAAAADSMDAGSQQQLQQHYEIIMASEKVGTVAQQPKNSDDLELGTAPLLPAWTRILPFEESPASIDANRKDIIERGVLSNKPLSFFRDLQRKIDQVDLEQRCQRYGFKMQHPFPSKRSTTIKTSRRIFYGSLIANEPWEVMDIVATEAYQVFAGMVFVESNRTQNFSPRPYQRDEEHAAKLQTLFGTPLLQIRRHFNENRTLGHMEREQDQRKEILKGWKEMGMTPQDIGYLTDVDETFSRDFFRAVQTCPYIPFFDYEAHHCDNRRAKLYGYTRVFETSPECIVKSRSWFHPDMVMGACIEGIGNETLNPLAPRIRAGLQRARGHATGDGPNAHDKIQGNRYPLFSAGDFRTVLGGQAVIMKAPNYARYTAFHLHNFFTNFEATRHKYRTYGHPKNDTLTSPLEDLHKGDLRLMVRCVRNLTDAPNDKSKPDRQPYGREVGGAKNAFPPLPIYFMDQDYRDRKHKAIQYAVEEDERRRRDRLQMSPLERRIEDVEMQRKEAQRVTWAKEEEARELRLKLKKKDPA